MNESPDIIESWTELVHHSVLVAALESYRGEDVSGTIVGCHYPSDKLGFVELKWAGSEPSPSNSYIEQWVYPCRHRFNAPRFFTPSEWCPICREARGPELVDDLE